MTFCCRFWLCWKTGCFWCTGSLFREFNFLQSCQKYQQRRVLHHKFWGRGGGIHICACFYSHITAYLNVFFKHQHWFCKHFWCSAQFAKLTHRLQEAINHIHETDAVFLHFSEGSDSILHKCVNLIFQAFKIEALIDTWNESFLSSGLEYASLEHTCYSLSHIASGSPGGLISYHLSF